MFKNKVHLIRNGKLESIIQIQLDRYGNIQ